MRMEARIDAGIRYVEVAPAGRASGTTFLLIHGLGGSLEQWHYVVLALGADARTLAIDVPGFGQSRTLDGSFDLDRSVAAILAFCRRLKLTSCTVVSHSVGCVVAARLVTVAPDIFTGLIFVSGTLVRAAEMTQRPSRALANPRLAALVALQFTAGLFPIPRIVLRALAASPALRHAMLWPFVAQPREISGERLLETLSGTGSIAVGRILFSARQIDYLSIMSAIPRPVDLVWGAEDLLISNEDVDLTRRLADIGSSSRIEQCGHWPWLERPQELVDFIRSRSTDAPTNNQHA